MTKEASRSLIALVILNNSGIGGTERRFAQVYAHLQRRHEAVTMVLNESLKSALERTGCMGVDRNQRLVIREPFSRLATFLFGRQQARNCVTQWLAFSMGKLDYALACVVVGWWMLRHRPALLHLVLGGAYVVLPLQMVGLAPPSVVSVVCPSLRTMVGSVLALPLFRLALRKARLVDALTDSIRETLEREGVSRERLRVSPGSCVDPERFHAASIKQPWVVFSGRFIPEKNPDLFVEACAMVHKQVRSARFFLLGDGPMMKDIEARVRSLGLQSCILHMGWCEHVETILSETLVFVSLQKTDNYPSQALLEAMACEAAVVATNEGLTQKLVGCGEGFLVEAQPTAIADAVVLLLKNPDQARAMGKVGRERVIREHSFDRYIDYLQEVYAEAGGPAMSR